MRVLIVPNMARSSAKALTIGVATELQSHNVGVILQDECMAELRIAGATSFAGDAAYAACDMVLTVGGDGTLLHAARHAMAWQKPILGVNSGRLGFLAILEKEELCELGRLARKEFLVEDRSVLQVSLSGKKEVLGLALNDIVLCKRDAGATIALDICCDDTRVSSFRGDGVIFATATGSTAYSMSAGGPILDARLGGVVVTQICPHIVQAPSMVFAPDRVLRAIPRGEDEETIVLSCDGQQNISLPWGAPIEIKKASVTVPLVQFSDAGQLESIDKKLKWR